jgi:hypothetical protein
LPVAAREGQLALGDAQLSPRYRRVVVGGCGLRRDQPVVEPLVATWPSRSRLSFRGRGMLLFSILGVSMFPQVAVLSGGFELIRWLGLYRTLSAFVSSYARRACEEAE